MVGWLGLAALALGAWTLLRRAASEQHPLILLAASPFLSCLLLMLVCAFGLAHLGALPCLILAALLTGGIAWKLPPGEPMSRPQAGAHWLFLALGAAIALLGALFTLSVSQVVEDAFFIHTSNMGLIQRGYVPPLSPLGETLQGHYGKDLLTSALAAVTGVQFLTTEWVSTAIFQVGTFLLLYGWVARSCGSRLQAALVAGFAFFASYFGTRPGLMSCDTNNLPVAFAALVLGGYLCQRALELRAPASVVLAGVVLGAQSLIYETYYGLMVLALGLAYARRRNARPLIAVLALSLALACSEGGALTQITHRLLSGHAHDTTTVSQTVQSQQLQIHVPKRELFQLRRDNLRPSLPFDTRARPYAPEYAASHASAPIWSEPIVSCFWYPVWLWPLTAVWLWRRGSRNGYAAWFFGLGWAALLIPSVVDFGYFNNESARWLIVTALGLTVAFVSMLGDGCAWGVKGWRLASGLLLSLLLVVSWPGTRLALESIAHCVTHPGATLPDGSPGIVPGGSLLPDPRRSLAYHYGFTTANWDAAIWLRDHARKGERFLSNYPDESPPDPDARAEVASGRQLNLLGISVGLTELFPGGITPAPRNRFGSPMMKPSLEAWAFWSDLRPERLEALGVRWILASQLENALREQLRSTLSEVYDRGRCQVFSVPERTFPEAGGPLVIEKLDAPLELDSRRARQVTLRVTGTPGLHRIELGYRDEASGIIANQDDLLLEPLRLDGSGQASATLVGPCYGGSYTLVWRPLGSSEWTAWGEARVRYVDTTRGAGRTTASRRPRPDKTAA